MSTNPQSMNDAFEKAFNYLLTATNSESNRNAFRYFLPDQANVWAAGLSGGESGHLAGCTADTMRMDLTIRGRWKSIAEAHEFVMGCLSIVPVRSDTPIIMLHADQNPTIVESVEVIANAAAANVFFLTTQVLQLVWDARKG